MHERLGIAGSGAIACGLAAAAARHGEVVLWARSDGSARAGARERPHDLRAPERRDQRRATCAWRPTWTRSARPRRSSRRSAEDEDDQGRRPGRPRARSPATTRCWPARPRRCRSSAWRGASGAPERFVGLHVFNPVPEDEARRAGLPGRGHRHDARARPRAVRGAGQDRGRGPRPAGLRGQPPALPLSLQRGRPPWRRPAWRRGRRPVHDARRRAPDGAARAAGLRRPRRRGGHRRRHRRRRPERLRTLVAEGALGRKSGRGLYNHD